MYKELKDQGALVNDIITTSDPIIPNVFHYVRYVVSQVISSPPAEERGKLFLICVVLFPIVCELIQYGLQFKKKEDESQLRLLVLFTNLSKYTEDSCCTQQMFTVQQGCKCAFLCVA